LTPPSQPVQIRNAGTGSLNWTLTTSTSDGGSWLNVSSGNEVAPSSVMVSLVKANLPGAGVTAGTFIGQLVFQATGSKVTIPVSVVVGNGVFSQVNGISFTKLFSGANPSESGVDHSQ